jgi:hypothetical protein
VIVGGSAEALLGWAVTLQISVELAGEARGLAGKELLGSLRASIVGARAQLFARVPDSVAGAAGYASAGALAAAVVADPLAPNPVVVPWGGTLGDLATWDSPANRAALGVGLMLTLLMCAAGGFYFYVRQRRAAGARRAQGGVLVSNPVEVGRREGR